MKRSLIALQALLASSAVLCQSADATSTYNAPDQTSNLESRIEKVRNGNWSSLLKSVDLNGELVAKSKWGNGGGHKFKNSRGSGKWKNLKV
jgi:rSAM-associated Gly-rich repeat protein